MDSPICRAYASTSTSHQIRHCCISQQFLAGKKSLEIAVTMLITDQKLAPTYLEISMSSFVKYATMLMSLTQRGSD